MSKLVNALKIIRILESSDSFSCITRKDLSSSLGVSERMIRNYIKDIIEAGYDVVSVSGRNGGYYIKSIPKD